MNDLEKEIATYNRLFKTLLSDEGKFAVINGNDLLGIYVAYEDALKIGYEKCGIDKRFLVKKILSDENVSYFSRDLNNSCLA